MDNIISIPVNFDMTGLTWWKIGDEVTVVGDASDERKAELRSLLVAQLASGSAQAVPATVTRRQLVTWLRLHGHQPSEVDALIAAMPDSPDKIKAQIDWEESSIFERYNPRLIAIAGQLGITDIDAVFIEAATY